MSLPDKLGIGIREEPASSDSSGALMQKCVIIQRDERGYGFTVSGDNPVFVASVKQDGAAARAGVQNGDRIVKVNGTLVTQRNHLDVVKLIKAGSYVALTLLGKPSPSATSGGVVTNPSTLPYIRDSGSGRVTAPQPVDPDKDRELWQQKVHMTRAMYETAREDFEKLQKQYVSKPSEKLHSQLLEKEKTVKALENQLKQLTGGEEPVMVSPLLPATTPDLGNMSDSSQTSPSVSPTPEDADGRQNGQDMEDLVGQQEIIPPEYEEDTSEDDQTTDHGPFADIKLLENKPAHMSVFLNYLISNSDPSSVLFHIISELYSRSPGSNKELRKWAYEIFSTFIYKLAPLSISVDDNTISQIDNVLASSGSRADNENVLRGMFQAPRQFVQVEIADLLCDFRTRKDLGMGTLYGIQKIYDNMDRPAEVRVAEELLVPHLRNVGTEESSHGALVDRDLATAWALATYLRSLGGPKSAYYGMIERVQTFMMKDKKSLKFPGSRSSRAKALKGHQFNLQHFYVTTFCTFCGNLVWGVGYQGYVCQNCEIVLHKTCAEEITEACCGKKKIRPRIQIPGVIQTRRQSSNVSGQQQQPQPPSEPQSTTPGRSPSNADVTTQPFPKDEDTELATLSGSHSVQNMVNRFLGMASPTGTSGGSTAVTSQEAADSFAPDSTDGMRRVTPNLNRTGSLNNKKKSERPARRAKSDVDVDPDTFKEINQSASSSASSLSNRSIESPGNSTDNVSDLLRAQYDDPDMDLEPELPPLKQVLSEEVLRKLKPKEKKRQEVINELFYTERAHLRNLKVLDLLFNRPMFQEKGIMAELARALFPNMEEMISLHVTFVRDIKDRSLSTPVVKEVGDLLLKRFDGDAGERFRKGCAEYCRNQAFALDALKKQTRKEPKLQQFLHDAESNSLCRRLQLKDLVPSQMQRLTKYPLLIDNLLKYTLSQSEEYRRIERALERCKHILAYVNQAVKECENYHKLKDIQKKLDRRPLEGLNDPAVAELKNLDLTQHKLIFDSPLTWKLRSHRTVDLHVLLLEDLLVLLQKQDDKYVLKCQNTNVQSARDDKYTHFPVLKLQNLLARTLATEKRSFFVVNISESRAQMYEFTAVSSELRLKWCKLINDKADEFKRMSNLSQQTPRERNAHPRIPQNNTSLPSETSGPAMDDIYEVTDQLSRRLAIGEDQHSEGELILPEEVHISDAVTTKTSEVSSPQDILHHNWLQLEDALSERDHLLTNLLNQSCVMTAKPADTQMTGSREDEEEVEDDDDKSMEFLLAKAMDINSRLMSIVNDSCQVLAPQQQQQQFQQQCPPDLSNPSVPTRPPSTLSPVVSCQQTQPPPQLQQQPSLGSPVPMEQLKTMAAEMNAILSKLAGAINSGQDEKQRLRQELERAQLSLDSLKQMKKQMTEAGTSPSDKTSVPLLTDIPLTSFTSSAETPDSDTATVGSSIERQHEDFTSASSDLALLSEPEAEMLKQKYGLESIIQGAESLTSSLTETEGQSGSSLETSSVDLRIKEATVTQLEESVEHLSFYGEVPTEVDPVIATETHTAEARQMTEDYDDDSNEVSVADLPLPDLVSLCEVDIVSLAQRRHDVDVDDSEVESDDCDTLNSKANSHRDLSGATTTFGDIPGEMVGKHAAVSYQASSSVLHAEIVTSADDDDDDNGGGACGDGYEASFKGDSEVGSSSVDGNVIDRSGGGDAGAV